MKKKVYMWLLAMCVTAGTATPVYAVEPVAEQSTVEEKTSENNGENSGEENSGEEKAPENSGVNSSEEKAPENSGVNSGGEKEPENGGVNSGGEKEPEDGGVNSGEGKDTENSGENAVEEEKSGEVAEVPEDELALQELEEENQIAAFSASQPVTTFVELKTALEDETCSEIQVSGTISVTETLIVNREVKLSGGGTLVRGVKNICLIAVGGNGGLTLKNVVLDGRGETYRWDRSLLQVENGGSLTLQDGAVFQNNHTNSYGGAIRVFDGFLIMDGGTIQNNETSQEGGGIYIYKGSFVLKNGGTICNNKAKDNGGGIYVGSEATFRMEGGEISGNTGYSGGMLLDCSQTAEITGGTIKGNTATGTGGGIFARCQVHIQSASITGNTATHGGGISVLTTNGKAAGVVMDGGSITGNAAKQMERYSWGDGGGVYLDGAELTLNKGAIISDNTAERDGGGIYSDGTITMNDGKITNNTGVYGGGIYNEWSSNASIVTINGGEISRNTSKEGSGGGIVNHKTLIMTGGSVTGNKAKEKGGGIHQYRDFQVSGTVRITGNTESEGKTSNVFLDYKTYNETEPNRYVTIVSPGLSSGSQIGVNINPDKDLNITQAVNDADYSKYFTSDDSNYEIMNVESNGKHQVSLKKTGSGNTGGSESGGSTGGNTGGSESGGSTGGNTGGSESGGTTGGNNSGNTSGSTTGTSTGTSGGSSAGTAASTPATTTPKETTITVPLQADTQESTLETGNLPANLQQRVLSQKISHTVLSSAETGVKVGLDIEAVRAISGQAQGDASVVVQKLDNTALKGSAAAVIGTRPVVTVRVQDAAGKAITDLGAGSALVEIPYVLQNGENPGNICAVSTDAEGNVQWILNSVYDSEKQVLRFRTLQGADYGVASIPMQIYQDTIGTDKQADIAFAVSRGLLAGDAKGQDFDPEKAVTMEEFSTALDRMTGKKVSDVVLGNFVPTQSITREDMAVLLAKYADTLGIILPKVQTANAFADQNRIQTEALSAVQRLQQAEVLEAKENQNFAPKEEVTRAECCTTLRLFMEMMVKGTCRTN